jgi:uncharacterized membrane protein (DUF4010 family)
MIVDLAIALGLGLLVGLQRERSERAIGLRTFALATLLGALSVQLSAPVSPLLLPAMVIVVGVIASFHHYLRIRRDETAGMTTEVALMVMFLTGAYVAAGNRRVGVIVGGTVAVLLQAKQPFRRVMERLGDEDVRAIMQFALLSLVILPVLPNRDFGPWGVLNPFEIWLLVVLIVGINVGGYIVYKFVGANAGALVGGILGGVISSTATTVSYARRSKDREDSSPLAAVVILLATTVVLVRVVIEIGAVSRELLRAAWMPIAIVFVVAAVLSFVAWWRSRDGAVAMPEHENPTALRAALTFAALYAVVLLAAAWVREQMGSAGLYVVAIVAGLTDVDAITLSTARMAGLRQIEAAQAWRVIVLAFVANLVFKAGIVAFAGTRRLFIRTAIYFGIIGAAAGALIAFWPA